MKPFDYFEEIYCINLERRKDRWDLWQSEFEKIGIEPIFLVSKTNVEE